MYDTAKKQAADLRESKQQLTVEEYARTNNMEKAAVVRQMAQREKAKSIFQKLSYYNGKAHTPLKQILVPDHPDNMESTTWTEVVEATAIWEALLNDGRRAHFSQASDTPFVTGPVAHLIGPYDFNEHAQDILNGTFDIDSITDNIELRDIVKAMRYDNPSNPPNIDCSISIKQLKQGFKDANESTSSSPTGLHYGHWKSLLHDDDLFLPYGLMIIFAGKFGIPPSQWEEAVQPIIEKDPGNPKITRMRRLCLLDSAMNMLFCIIFGHRMLHKASELGILSQYQFGACGGHMAIGAVFLKCISYDLCRLMAVCPPYSCG